MNILHKFIEKYNWKTLILTTTTAEKIRIAMDCKNHYENRGILTLMHKTGGLNSKANQKNVNHLRENPDTILIWSKSYMEWVDVPWNNLSLVVLTKLPFLPPRPFIDFKENQYKNKWYKFVYRFLSSINFRQAIWRLIRHQTDLGEILILDERISEKSWEFFRDYIKGEEVIEI
jgi:Rad3-related DNA helicase